MRAAEIVEYIEKLFSNGIYVSLAVLGTLAYRFIFPEQQYLYGALAVFVIMLLDLVTKLYALAHQSDGFRNAVQQRKITSAAFGRGTLDKLLVFGVMLVVCGCAYRISLISELAVWFAQIVFTLMFLRDVLSILENLRDAGVQGLGLFQKVIKKKMSEYVETDETEENK